MHSIPILAAFFGGLAVAKASTGGDSCTTTVTTVANPAPYAITSGLNSASTLMISAAPNNSEAASTVDSLVSGAAASSLPVSFGSDFTNPASGSASELPHPTISFLTGSALSSQASLVSANAGSSFSYNFTFGPGGGIYPTNSTTRTPSSSTTSTGSKTTTSTSTDRTTSTNTAAATITSAQPASGGAMEVQPKGAELALAIVAAVMLFL